MTVPAATDTASFIRLTAEELASCQCPASALRDFMPAELYPELEAALESAIAARSPRRQPRHRSAADALLALAPVTDSGVRLILEEATP